MALLSEVAALLAEHDVDTNNTLTVFLRRLREAGRLSQKGRGRGAAHATLVDGARLLIACAATDHPERAVDAESVFSNAVFSDGQGYADIEVGLSLDAASAPTLDLAVAKLLEAISSNSISDAALATAKLRAKQRNSDHIIPVEPFVSLRVNRSAVSAVIQVGGNRWTYVHPKMAEVIAAESYRDMQLHEADFSKETLRFRTGKNLMAEFMSPTLSAVANLIAKGGSGK